ncbi:unnamed protein product [Adineta steineri]|uniref:Uncharacterized protein n=1 Tax=Adineta steineri TaxID=433720 RepID=A0A819PJM4_9BILA|nr:unnamed protein product [Adineta steineri]
MRQFRLLSDSTDAPKPSALGRQVVIVAPDNQTNDKNNQSSIEHSRIKQKKTLKDSKYLRVSFLPSHPYPQDRDRLGIVYALINKYYRLAIENIEEGESIGQRMREIWNVENTFQKYLREINQATTLRWSKYDAAMCFFSTLTEEDVRNLTFGSYQIRMAKSYIADHLQQSYINDKQLAFTVELCERHDDLVRVPFQSRHSNRKKYIATIQFNEQDEKPITEWYCTCFVGGGEVTTKLLNAINNSMTFSDQEDNSANDDGYFGAFAMTTSVNNDDDLD